MESNTFCSICNKTICIEGERYRRFYIDRRGYVLCSGCYVRVPTKEKPLVCSDKIMLPVAGTSIQLCGPRICPDSSISINPIQDGDAKKGSKIDTYI